MLNFVLLTVTKTVGVKDKILKISEIQKKIMFLRSRPILTENRTPKTDFTLNVMNLYH